MFHGPRVCETFDYKKHNAYFYSKSFTQIHHVLKQLFSENRYRACLAILQAGKQR